MNRFDVGPGVVDCVVHGRGEPSDFVFHPVDVEPGGAGKLPPMIEAHRDRAPRSIIVRLAGLAVRLVQG